MLTPEQLETARALRNAGFGWTTVAQRTGATYYSVRAELDPGYREMAARHVREARQYHRARLKQTRRVTDPKRAEYHAPGFTAGQLHEPTPVVPRDVLFERERAMQAPRSLTAITFGDPTFERSALGKKLQELHDH